LIDERRRAISVVFFVVLLYYCHVKAEKNISFFGQENKREEHRLQTETSRIDNVDEDKLSDTDESEPFAEPKAKAARRNFQSTWLEKFKWLRYKKQCQCPPKNWNVP